MKALDRRTVLKGVGCALGLPLLEAMLPRSARAAAESAARSWVYRPAEKDGVAVSVWKPEKVTFKL